MKKIFFIALIIILSFPLSNLLGLAGKNEPIAVKVRTSNNFAEISTILQNKCIDCHSPNKVRLPFYSELPIAKQLIAKDIKAASQRFILDDKTYSGEKPFTQLMLARLESVINNNRMPPNLYLAMHWSERLNQTEKETITKWIKRERANHVWSQGSSEAHKGESVQTLPLTTQLDAKKVQLGDKLFHETLLSGDDTLSCASCHSLNKGGTDQLAVSTGIRGQQGPINSPTVYNAMYNLAQFWDGRAKDLQTQAAGPVANPIEMGARWEEVINKLKKEPEYQEVFSQLYPDKGLNKETVTDAIAIFEKSLLTPNSRFDQYLRGKNDALSSNEKEGYLLFKQNCTSCHFGPALGGLSYEKMGVKQDYFAIRGSELTEVDNGVFNVTKKEADRYFFKVPVLRNVELTYPYFHDGSVKSLSEAVRIMGKVQVDKTFSDEQVSQLVSFLKTLTGEYEGKPLSIK